MKLFYKSQHYRKDSSVFIKKSVFEMMGDVSCKKQKTQKATHLYFFHLFLFCVFTPKRRVRLADARARENHRPRRALILDATLAIVTKQRRLFARQRNKWWRWRGRV